MKRHGKENHRGFNILNNSNARNVFLSLFFTFGLLVLVGFSLEAAAHESSQGYTHEGEYIEAKDVGIDSEEEMKEFLSHVLLHFNLIQNNDALSDEEKSRQLTIIGRRFREEGIFKHDDVYTWGINERRFITSHPAYPELLGSEFKPDAEDSPVADPLGKLIDKSKPVTDSVTINSDDLHCERYQYGDEDRVACAAKVDSPSGKVTSIVGLHHAKRDPAIDSPDCTVFKLEPSAKDVYEKPNEANLKAYVKEVIREAQEFTQRINMDIQADIPLLTRLAGETGLTLTDLANLRSNPTSVDPVKLENFIRIMGRESGARLYDKIACFSTGDFKHENIYTFALYAGEDLTVLINGNNFDLNGLSFNLKDDELPGDDKSVATLFRNELLKGESEYRAGQSATVSYRWDDPKNLNDDVPDWLENNLVPGTSLKKSYIEVANINERISTAPAALAIFGSGIYGEGEMMPPTDMMDDDDDGCAIAGAGHTPQSALLNLFLMASVLLSAVFLIRKRA